MPEVHSHGPSVALLSRGRVLVAGGLGLGEAPVATAAIYHAKDGTWTATGSMQGPRWQHTTTLLSNGKVLVTGGLDANNDAPTVLTTAELYDPQIGAWTATGEMVSARAQHTATLLPNGKVLVAGGFDNNAPVASAEIYDPQVGTWGPTGSMTGVRFSHTATRMIQGNVLVAGGRTSAALTSAEVYGWKTGAWRTTGSLISPRSEHTALQLKGGRVLITGGTDIDFPPPVGFVALESAEVYTPKTGIWSSTGHMNTARFGHSMTRLKDGRILVAGGGDKDVSVQQSAEVYDDNTKTWTLTASMHTPRTTHIAARLHNGKVLVAGGFLIGTALSSAELYSS